MNQRFVKASTSTFVVLSIAAFAIVITLLIRVELDFSQRSHAVGFWLLDILLVLGAIAQVAHIWHKALRDDHNE